MSTKLEILCQNDINYKSVKRIVKIGENINLLNGKTCLEIAKKNHCKKIIWFLTKWNNKMLHDYRKICKLPHQTIVHYDTNEDYYQVSNCGNFNYKLSKKICKQIIKNSYGLLAEHIGKYNEYFKYLADNIEGYPSNIVIVNRSFYDITNNCHINYNLRIILDHDNNPLVCKLINNDDTTIIIFKN